MNTTAYVHKLIQESGPRALYRGFSWNVLGGVPSEVAYYATYTHAKELMLQTRTGQQYPSAVFFCAGLLSDVLSVLLWVPADIVSQRLQLQDSLMTACVDSSGVDGGGSSGSGSGSTSSFSSSGGSGSSKSSSSSSGGRVAPRDSAPQLECAAALESGTAEASGLQIISQILKREGVRGLWRGTVITLATLAPSSAVWWLTHEEAKQRLAWRMGRSEESAFVLTASGTLAAVSATLASMPLDVLKTRLQCSQQPLTVLETLREVLSASGWGGLFSGFIPRLAAAVPRSVCTVLFYERAIALCRMPPRQ
eukprot:CAMPEP_0174709838 /NCGR_PEP_ID=MMETSP1094-20130205/11662_1 /TAXON_ID=156173 /ORGANISM="Chrysochromulina brevifilum, Strain UTEX LB 985" /LENGTH=307 /DNA_ID=CAMNT_0015908557 /DNA_START=40 /DNA_END=963 /DNA_ORIENTATION=+